MEFSQCLKLINSNDSDNEDEFFICLIHIRKIQRLRVLSKINGIIYLKNN